MSVWGFFLLLLLSYCLLLGSPLFSPFTMTVSPWARQALSSCRDSFWQITIIRHLCLMRVICFSFLPCYKICPSCTILTLDSILSIVFIVFLLVNISYHYMFLCCTYSSVCTPCYDIHHIKGTRLACRCPVKGGNTSVRLEHCQRSIHYTPTSGTPHPPQHGNSTGMLSVYWGG